MATQAYIMRAEGTLIDATEAIDGLRCALISEQQINGGTVYPQNRDCWGTLHLNALQLKRQLDLLLSELGRVFPDTLPTRF